MSTNHKPEIPDGSEAIWDRLRLIPFNQRFAGKDADKRLPQKLREELPGVLLWAVQGCVEWYENGLGSAPAVEAATAAYRSETDVIERFLDEECLFGEEYCVSKKDLFEAWEKWCLDEGEDPGKQNGFTRDLGEKGVVKNFRAEKLDKNTRGWVGITLRNGPKTDPETKVSPDKKSCKHEGGETSERHFSEDSENFSENGTRVGVFRKSTKKCLQTKKVSPASPPPFGGPRTKWSGSTYQ